MPIWARGPNPTTKGDPLRPCRCKITRFAKSNPRCNSSSFLFCASATKAWAGIRFTEDSSSPGFISPCSLGHPRDLWTARARQRSYKVAEAWRPPTAWFRVARRNRRSIRNLVDKLIGSCLGNWNGGASAICRGKGRRIRLLG